MTSAAREHVLNNKRAAEFILLLFFLFLISACSNPGQRQQSTLNGSTMGTVKWSVKFITSVASQLSESQVNATINAELQRIDQLLSTYLEDSELSRFNRNGSAQWITVSKDFVEVMAEASRISQLTNGAFDVTVAPVVNLWGFGSDGAINKIPDDGAIKQLLDKIGLSKNRNRCRQPTSSKIDS